MNLYSAIFERYISHSGLKQVVSDEAFIRRMIRFEIALATCQAKLGIIPSSSAEAIHALLKDIDIRPSELTAGTLADGVPTVAFLNLCRGQLAAEHRGSLHFGATSQDIIDTAVVLMMKESAAVMEGSIAEVVAALDTLIESYGEIPCMMRTRHRSALPGKLGSRLGAWRNPLVRQQDRLKIVGQGSFNVQLGGPVGDGQTLGLQYEKLVKAFASALELTAAPAWHNQRDSLCEFSGWMAVTTGILAKMGTDLLVMASDEVGEVHWTDGGGASSSMPHKQNPVRCEALVAIARLTASLQQNMLQALVHDSERDGISLIQEWFSLPQMILLTGSALDHAQSLVQGLAINKEAMARNVDSFRNRQTQKKL